MPETPEQFFLRVRAAVGSHGYRDPGVAQRSTWPFDGEVTPRALQYPLLPEPPRAGEGGRPCGMCRPQGSPIWTDEHFRLDLDEGSGLPFAAWLVPHDHLDVSDLDDAAAARLGVLLVHLDRAVRSVLAVTRVHIARWGDDEAHGHVYVYARPAGAMQLRGPFLALWSDLLPPVPPWIRDRDAGLVVRALARTAGGRAAPTGA